jgi:hypothetical protein
MPGSDCDGGKGVNRVQLLPFIQSERLNNTEVKNQKAFSLHCDKANRRQLQCTCSVVDPDPESDPDPVGSETFCRIRNKSFRIRIRAALIPKKNLKQNFSDKIHNISTKCTININKIKILISQRRLCYKKHFGFYS